MSEPTSEPVAYVVVYPERFRSELRRLIAQAETPEQASRLLAAFKEIDRLLHLYPQFGEPLLDLHEPGQICIGTVAPAVIRYAIYEQRRLVMVGTLPKLLPSTPQPDADSD